MALRETGEMWWVEGGGGDLQMDVRLMWVAWMCGVSFKRGVLFGINFLLHFHLMT